MDRLFIKKLFGISLPVMAEKFAFSTGKVVVNSVGVDYGTQTVGALGVSNSISALSTVRQEASVTAVLPLSARISEAGRKTVP